MGVIRDGSNIKVTDLVAGSVFPTNEKDTVYPVLVDGTKALAKIEGSLYGRAIELRGDVAIFGPVVARGDLKIDPSNHVVRLLSGLTVNGSVNCAEQASNATPDKASILESVRHCDLIIKGDVSANQNVVLRNTVVVGSVRAVNCVLDHSVVLGTCIVEEHLTVRMSSLGGYASRDAQFEGSCMMIHALGESLNRPKFLPHESVDGKIFPSDVRYYPAIRQLGHLFNLSSQEGSPSYPDFSLLNEVSDWVASPVTPNPALDEQRAEVLNKWILSIGGRIGDVSVIADAIDSLTRMLKCAFEFEHYHPQKRPAILAGVVERLTPEESWVLQSTCH